MLQHQDHFHGSDLEKIEKIYGIRKEEIISFSANVNPLGISPLLRRTLTEHIDAITAYPDREYTSLRQCIAGYCGCEAEHVIVGNGSTELISLFIQIEHPKKAGQHTPPRRSHTVIPSPAFVRSGIAFSVCGLSIQTRSVPFRTIPE